MPAKVGVGLKPVQSVSQRVIPSKEVLENEYASRYLEHIGVTITKDNVETLLKELPIEKALVMPVWARGEMAIFPGLASARKSDIDHIVKSMYRPADSGDNDKKKKGGGNLDTQGKGKGKGTRSDHDSQKSGQGQSPGDRDGEEQGEGGSHTARSDTSEERDGNDRQRARGSESGSGSGKRTGSPNTSGGAGAGSSGKRAVDPTTATATGAATASRRPKLDAQPEIARTATPMGRKISWATVHTLDMDKYSSAGALGAKGGGATGGLLAASNQTMALSRQASLTLNLPGGERLPIEDVLRRQFQQLLEPPNFQHSDLDGSISLFCSSMGQYSSRVKEDTSGELYNKVKKLLESPKAHKLFGLLCHYSYWNVLHPWARGVLKVASTYDAFQFVGNAGGGSATMPSRDATGGGGGGVGAALSLSDLDSVTSLPNADKERIYVQLQECLLDLLGTIGSTSAAIVTSQQCLVCCGHYVVDDLLTALYPWLNAHLSKGKEEGEGSSTSAAGETAPGGVGEEEEQQQGQGQRQRAETDSPKSPDSPDTTRSRTANSGSNNNADKNANATKIKKKKRVPYSAEARELSLKIRRLMHQCIADLLDPSRIYTNHMLVSSYVGTDAKSLHKKRGKGRFFVTSVAVRSVFGDAHNDSTRRFMMNREDTYVATPGIPKKFDEKAAAAADEEQAARQQQQQQQQQQRSRSALPDSLATSAGNRTGAETGMGYKTRRASTEQWKSAKNASFASSSSSSSSSSLPLDFKNIFGASALKFDPNGSAHSRKSNLLSPHGTGTGAGAGVGVPLSPDRSQMSQMSPSHSQSQDGDMSYLDGGLNGDEDGDVGGASSILDNMSLGQSSSQHTAQTARSVANNKAASFKVSLQAKALLMGKVVKHKAELYSDMEKARKKILYG